MKKREKKPAKKITKNYLHNSGLYYLQRYPASIAHFKTVMRRKIDRSAKDHPDTNMVQCFEWLDAVAEEFESLGYLNDNRYADGLIQSLLLRGRSQKQIETRLRQAGVPQDISNTLLKARLKELVAQADHLPIPSNWPLSASNIADYIAALKYAKKRRIGPYKHLSMQEKPEDKALAMLARSGFSYDIAQTILKTGSEEAQRLLDEAKYLF